MIIFSQILFTFQLNMVKINAVIKMKEFEYYIFDFDGTLVDSSEGIYNSIIYALKEFGI